MLFVFITINPVFVATEHCFQLAAKLPQVMEMYAETSLGGLHGRIVSVVFLLGNSPHTNQRVLGCTG